MNWLYWFGAIGVVFACITAIIAAGKRYNALLWFLIGFFVGPLGIIIVACLPENAPSSKYSPVASAPETERPCPQCGYWIPVGTKTCRVCSSSISS